ncbi:MAG: glycosyltransferase N-terminal domain-containing protein [Pseudomonadota bacterium]
MTSPVDDDEAGPPPSDPKATLGRGLNTPSEGSALGNPPAGPGAFTGRVRRRVAGILEPWADRAAAARVRRGEETVQNAHQRHGTATAARPPGPLVWFHAADTAGALPLGGVMLSLAAEFGPTGALVTTRLPGDSGTLVRRLPPWPMVQLAPHARPQAIGRFLDYWRPDVLLWHDGPEMAPLLDAALDRGVAVNLLTSAPDPWLPRRGRWRLRALSKVFLRDTADLAQVRAAGVAAARGVRSGLPGAAAAAPEVDPGERARLAAALEGRPIWIADGVAQEELPMVLHAHEAAARAMPRRVLARALDDECDLDTAAEALARANLAATGEDRLAPGGVAFDVVVLTQGADRAPWLALATVAFLGGSIARHGGRSPMAAAAVGAAVLYGPHVGYWADLYQRLRDAGAARRVTTGRELAQALSTAILPDRAADMAHRAWATLSDGAEAADTIAATLGEQLDAAP